jgi:hypothetical protein
VQVVVPVQGLGGITFTVLDVVIEDPILFVQIMAKVVVVLRAPDVIPRLEVVVENVVVAPVPIFLVVVQESAPVEVQ